MLYKDLYLLILSLTSNKIIDLCLVNKLFAKCTKIQRFRWLDINHYESITDNDLKQLGNLNFLDLYNNKQ